MKKVIIKEFNREFLGIDIMLYAIYFVLGFILLRFPEVEILNPVDYAPVLFFMFSFFSLLAYFLNRREGNYEYLFLGFINVLTGSFILANMMVGKDSVLVGLALLLFLLTVIFNKLYNLIYLYNNKNVNFYPKIISIILLVMVGLLTISPLFNKYAAANMILGYYFMAFGLINLLEVLIVVLIRNPKFDELLNVTFKDEKSKRKNVKLKAIKKKKIKKSTE